MSLTIFLPCEVIMHCAQVKDNECNNIIASSYARNPDVNTNIFYIDQHVSSNIATCLSYGSFILETNKTLVLESNIQWNSTYDLTLTSKHSIEFLEGSILANSNSASVIINAGMNNPEGSGTVTFDEQSGIRLADGNVELCYNPKHTQDLHKYNNAYPYHLHVSANSLEVFMLVNNINDLSEICYSPTGNYALSQDIDGIGFYNFIPIGNINAPFFGHFNGNGFAIANIEIVSNEYSGIFGYAFGTKNLHTTIFDCDIKNISVKGGEYVGIIVGAAQGVDFRDITFLQQNQVSAQAIAGGVLGSGIDVNISNIQGINGIKVLGNEYIGQLAGALMSSFLPENYQNCVGFLEN